MHANGLVHATKNCLRVKVSAVIAQLKILTVDQSNLRAVTFIQMMHGRHDIRIASYAPLLQFS